MISKPRYRNRIGQGLVEFAMVLPLLLFVLVGMAEFARIFAIYSNLFNAAREGTRYGVVHPFDVDGVLKAARDKVFIIDPAQVLISVNYDSGPGTAVKNSTTAGVGDRVLVRLYYDVEPMVPLLQPLMDSLYVETVSARTISSTGDPLPSTPAPTAELTGTPGTPEPTPTFTSTPLNTPTPTPAQVAPIHIIIPLRPGDTVVSGTAEPGRTVSLRDIQNPDLNLSTTVEPDGRFLFRLAQGLVAGHVIVVQGYGRTDWAIVEGLNTPTPTATSSPTPTLTPTPRVRDIALATTCGSPGSNSITVQGYNWPEEDVIIKRFYDGNRVELTTVRKQDFDINFVTNVTIQAADGVHTIEAWHKSGCDYVLDDSESFTVPCPVLPTATPTATPAYPNLVIESLALVNSAPISTHSPLTFTVSARNIGQTAVNNLFWVDLYVDPANAISPTNPLLEPSTSWAAVSSLAAGEAITVTLYHASGFETLGQHVAFALADTWNQVQESNEMDNLSTALAVDVTTDGVLPTPTPTFTPAPIQDGAISGTTWLYINGDVVPQGRVNVYCYSGDVLIAGTLSDAAGNYALENVPPGDYTVIGEATINDTLYTDIALNVIVNSGQTTQYTTLILH